MVEKCVGEKAHIDRKYRTLRNKELFRKTYEKNNYWMWANLWCWSECKGKNKYRYERKGFIQFSFTSKIHFALNFYLLPPYSIIFKLLSYIERINFESYFSSNLTSLDFWIFYFLNNLLWTDNYIAGQTFSI